jgi:hypothetical protein
MLGDRVRVLHDAIPHDWASDWSGFVGVVTALRFDADMPSGINVEIAPTVNASNGDRTDGFDQTWLLRLRTPL